MKNYTLIILFVLSSISAFCQSQKETSDFNPNLFKFNSAEASFFLLNSNDTIVGYIENVKAKNAMKLMLEDLSTIVVKQIDGDKVVEIPIGDIKEAYISSVYEKGKNVNFIQNHPLKGEIYDFIKNFTYVTNLKVKDDKGKEETIFVSLVNPSFSSKIKVFQSRATSTNSINGGKSVVKKSYVLLENGEVLEVSRKGYKEVASKLFEGCPNITNNRWLMYENFSNNVFDFDRGHCN